MTAQRKSAKLQLRRSISEQLRDSTSKAWDLLWRNVRERRLAGHEPPQATTSAKATAPVRPAPVHSSAGPHVGPEDAHSVQHGMMDNY
ncbi:hypothetical protein Q5P01_019349 [Channa striata]|uniref:Uncharacterized protein n=1 Tax=Channa striata TaxID=64152 RepID=A0AA88M0W1_CHASR|nr:hypothetical protein Q5P01_019349 [Channa striata]